MVRPGWTHAAILALALIATLGGSLGCARQPDRLWYKPGRPYTIAEFERDKATCSRGGKLNFDCMRSRGWVDVSGKRPASKEAPQGPAGGQY